MGYFNPIYIYGVDRFLADAEAAGRRRPDRRRPAARGGRRALPAGARRPASPSSASPRRRPTTGACRRCSRTRPGFVYYVSITGITGTATPDFGKVVGGGGAHQAPHDAAGRGRLRRQDRRARGRDRPRRRRRRGRLRAGRRPEAHPRRGRPRHLADGRGRHRLGEGPERGRAFGGQEGGAPETCAARTFRHARGPELGRDDRYEP